MGAENAQAPPSATLATLGNALGEAARPAVLLLAGIGYGPVVVGHLAAALSLVVLGKVAFYPALGTAVLRHREDFAYNRGLVRRFAGALLLGTLVIAIAGLVDARTGQWLVRVVPDRSWMVWVVLLALLTVAEQYALGLCSAAGVLDRYSVALLASRLLLLVGAAVVIVAKADPTLLLALIATSSLLLLGLAARALGRPPSGSAQVGLLRDGWAAAPNSWAWFLIAQASILIVQATMGPREAGLFTVAYLLLNLPVLALQGIALAWAARASRQGPAAEWRRTRRLVPQLVLGHLVVVILMATAGAWLWTRIAGPTMAPAFALLRGMAWGAPGFALAYLLMPQWTSRGWFVRLSVVYMGLAGAYLGVLAWAAKTGDLSAVAACTAALGAALAVVNLWAARHWGLESPTGASTQGPDNARRLERLSGARWKRWLNVQAPYRWNVRRLKLGRTLDLGCGIGRNLVHLDGNGVGVDHNPDSVAIARSRGIEAFTPKQFVASGQARPGAFDALLATHLVEHMTRDEALDLLRRYLPYVRPGGKVALVTPQERGFASDQTHVHFVDLQGLKAIAGTLGLVVERAYSFPLPRSFGRVFTHNEFVLVARVPEG